MEKNLKVQGVLIGLGVHGIHGIHPPYGYARVVVKLR